MARALAFASSSESEIECRKQARILKSMGIPADDDSELVKLQFTEHFTAFSAAIGAMKDAEISEKARQPYECLEVGFLKCINANAQLRLALASKGLCVARCQRDAVVCGFGATALRAVIRGASHSVRRIVIMNTRVR
jgi:hypothetical protein